MGAVVLFDGVCNFCDGTVNFIIRQDRVGYFKFAPLQSKEGVELAARHGLSASVSESSDARPSTAIDSVILVEHGRAYTHSTAALRIARKLGPPWSWLYSLVIVPRFIRDFFYQQFAKHRYRLFGRKEQCMIPTPDVRARFLG